MQYIDKISKIGIGISRFSTLIDIESAYQQLDIFINNGGTLIDTARNYYEWVENGRGKSEEFLGNWLEKTNNRSKVTICTKGGVSNIGKQFNISLAKNDILNEVDESLQALKTNPDIYLFHRDELTRPVEEIVETAQEVHSKLGVKHIGVSNWSFDRIKKANDYAFNNKLIPFTFFQNWWSIGDFKYEMWDDDNVTYMSNPLKDYIKENNFYSMAYSSQCKGYFQKYCKDKDNIAPFLKQRIETKTNLKRAEFIKEYCQTNNVEPTAVVSSYITSQDINSIALVSCNTNEQLLDIMKNSDYELSLDIINKINLL